MKKIETIDRLPNPEEPGLRQTTAVLKVSVLTRWANRPVNIYWDESLNTLPDALALANGKGRLYVSQETVNVLTRQFPEIAAQTLIPGSGLKLRPYVPDQPLEYLSTPADSEDIQFVVGERPGYALIDKDFANGLDWINAPNDFVGIH
ncbi:hypothetical protein A3A66_02480 [Microgenomates group bacterium RIFCSPLOWO2_01_FULL_46_13]|nr:MAG: hypothetical protein A2783_03265 [Microgenomates group bacterium RIFCSPHIGHO2_01_FULL_45_11]OGV94837.1 MAG: hypothetical protein A3A66_02480 [Microgenomates group bacterium RIFCSPLOWO2_01_FULL_46_13]